MKIVRTCVRLALFGLVAGLVTGCAVNKGERADSRPAVVERQTVVTPAPARNDTVIIDRRD